MDATRRASTAWRRNGRRRWCAVVVPMAAVLLLSGSGRAGAAAEDTDGEASLTVRHTMDVDATAGELVLLVTMAGEPPPDRIELVDDEGRATASVRALPGQQCGPRVPRRRSGLGEVPWCLRFKDLTAGQEVHGTLVGPQSSLALTVTTRHAPTAPVLVALASLLGGLLLAWLVAVVLPRVITWGHTTLALRRTSVAGLRAWHERALDHLSAADALARVRWLARSGPRIARGRREDLAAALAGAPEIPAWSPLAQAATTEANRTDLAADELLGADGSAITMPAVALAQLVARASRSIRVFERSFQLLLPEVPEGQQAGATADAERAMARLDGLDASTIDVIEDGFDRVLQLTRARIENGAGRLTTVIDRVRPEPPSSRARPSSIERAAIATLASAVIAVPVALVALALSAVAVAGVYWARYVPNHTFATFDDYAGLAVAAVGSSGVAAILTVLLLARGPARWQR